MWHVEQEEVLGKGTWVPLGQRALIEVSKVVTSLDLENATTLFDSKSAIKEMAANRTGLWMDILKFICFYSGDMR